MMTMAMKIDISRILETRHPVGVGGLLSINLPPISIKRIGQLAYCNRDGNMRQDGVSDAT